MKETIQSKVIKVIISFLLFAVLVILLQFSPLNTIHGRSQAPIIVAIFGVVSLVISNALCLKWQTIIAIFGYIVAFLLGVLFNTNGVDAGGGATNNLWQIWLVSYWVILFVGFVVSFILKKIKN